LRPKWGSAVELRGKTMSASLWSWWFCIWPLQIQLNAGFTRAVSSDPVIFSTNLVDLEPAVRCGCTFRFIATTHGKDDRRKSHAAFLQKIFQAPGINFDASDFLVFTPNATTLDRRNLVFSGLVADLLPER
jgi:hypothetical protein